ncbi:hypothetical protein PSACC_00769 [Paramicrosporidium saccamoebae]|uniref:Choline/ethanolaminephosphotransferase n=1 Tax=Paramicrosporidium saccamoebae TaxID=1246581 RepID=A0A2H9TNQ0_9FUNG|nr:hypothetical protein PSACC_00769 [Paramicrosporidium saccamoebae]
MYAEERLQPLRTYQYRGIDRSPISRYVLTPYWNWAVTLFPLWMAPNLITLIGLGFMLAALGVALHYTPDLVGPGPPWVYFFYAACLWVYSTLDNVDGKQARRTKSSSPLGELFDHGCDALNCSIGGIVQTAAMGAGSSGYALIVLGITFWAFYLPTWEEYHTGVLYLGYINGPTEGILAAIGMMCLSGIYGPAIWTRTFGEQFPVYFPPSTWLHSVAIPHCAIVFFGVIFLGLYVPTCVIAVHRACRTKKQSFRVALLQLLPMGLVSAAAYIWLWSPYSTIRVRHFALFALAFGVGFGKMATKIIYAHLTKRRFPYHSGLMFPLFAGAVLINIPLIVPIAPFITPTMELVYVWAWLVFALVGYFQWSYHVINSFCNFLNISCFTLKTKSK